MYLRLAKTLTRAKLALGLLSFVTTTLGIINLMADSGGGAVGTLAVAIPLAVLLSAVVQAIVMTSAAAMGKPGRFSVFAGSFGVWLVSASISTLFSVSYYFDQLGARRFVQEEVAAVGASLLDTAALAQAAVTERQEALTALSEQADGFAAQEAEGTGGTCPDLPAGRGKGPAYYKRTFEAARYAALAAQLEAAKEKLDRLIAEIRSAPFDRPLEGSPEAISRELSERRGRVHALRRRLQALYPSDGESGVDTELARYRAYEMAGFPTGDPTFERFAGRDQRCGSHRTVAALSQVLAARLPPLPPEPRLTGDPSEPGYAIGKVFASAISWLGFADASGPSEVQLFSSDYVLPIFLGILVDFWILVISVLVGFLGRAHARGNSARLVAIVERVAPSFRSLDPGDLSERRPEDLADGYAGVVADEYQRMIALGLIRYRDGLFLATPLETSPSLDPQDPDLIRRLDFLNQLKEALDAERLLLDPIDDATTIRAVVRGLRKLGIELEEPSSDSVEVFRVHWRAGRLAYDLDRDAGLDRVERRAAENVEATRPYRSRFHTAAVRSRSQVKAAYVLAKATTEDGLQWTIALDRSREIEAVVATWLKIYAPEVRTTKRSPTGRTAWLGFGEPTHTWLTQLTHASRWEPRPAPDEAATLVDHRPANEVSDARRSRPEPSPRRELDEPTVEIRDGARP